MALGSTYNNNENKKYQPTVYSTYGMSNAGSQVDPTSLSFKYWNNMLVITVTPKTPSSSVEQPEWDEKGAVSIYMYHTNARKLHDEIELFETNPQGINSVGIASGEGLITISDGKEFGVSHPVLVLRRINGQTGELQASIAYEFKTDYHFAVRNYDEKSNNYDKFFYDKLEIQEFKAVLKSYYEAMTGALAYTVVNNMKYDISRLSTKTDAIAEKLGVEFTGGSKKFGANKGSYFNSNNNNSKSFNSSTADDIDGLLED